MKIKIQNHGISESGSIIMFFVILLVLISSIASISALVIQTLNVSQRRSNMVQAMQLAEGGAALAAEDLEMCYTNLSAPLTSNLLKNATGSYSLNSKLTTAKTNVYERIIKAPFTEQSVTAQIWMTNSPNPPGAKIVAIAKVNSVSQSTDVQILMKFGFGAAIISDHPGTTSAGITKSVAQQGNVVISGDKTGPLVIDGGSEKAIWANGHVNYNSYTAVASTAVSMTNLNCALEVPDYTADGSSDQLFNFNRFIAVANKSGNHHTNLTSFMNASKTGAVLEGIVVVDIKKSDNVALDTNSFPLGINIRGTLLFNFSSEFAPSDKIINTATIKINPANLSLMNPADPKTYTTGYPATYSNPAKNPVNVDISTLGFANFASYEDLPALMYNVGILDIHGNANICGTVYSPSFMEIENKLDNQIQYFKGSLIGGGGVFVENNKNSKTIVSYDGSAVDLLATSSNKGKRVYAVYWH